MQVHGGVEKYICYVKLGTSIPLIFVGSNINTVQETKNISNTP